MTKASSRLPVGKKALTRDRDGTVAMAMTGEDDKPDGRDLCRRCRGRGSNKKAELAGKKDTAPRVVR
jgi:hypothetical protein